MEIYYILLGLLYLFCFLEKADSKNGIIFFNIIIVILILFLGLRYGVGNDYYPYLSNYNGINYGGGTVTANEPLYLLVNAIFSFEGVVFFFAFFSLYFLRKAIIFFASPNFLVLTLLVYYCLYLTIFNIHILRQGLAIAMVLYAFVFLYKEDWKKFIGLVIIASLFHLSAVFVLPFGLIIKKNMKMKYQFILLTISFIIALNSVFFTNLFFSVGRNMPLLGDYFSVYRLEEVVNYGFSAGIIMDICLLLFFMSKIETLNSRERFIYNIFYISVILSLILMVSPAMLRLNYYFRITNIFMLPLLYNYFKIKPIPVLIVIGISTLYLIFAFNSTGEYGRGDRNLKYKTIFEK